MKKYYIAYDTVTCEFFVREKGFVKCEAIDASRLNETEIQLIDDSDEEDVYMYFQVQD